MLSKCRSYGAKPVWSYGLIKSHLDFSPKRQVPETRFPACCILLLKSEQAELERTAKVPRIALRMASRVHYVTGLTLKSSPPLPWPTVGYLVKHISDALLPAI